MGGASAPVGVLFLFGGEVQTTRRTMKTGVPFQHDKAEKDSPFDPQSGSKALFAFDLRLYDPSPEEARGGVRHSTSATRHAHAGDGPAPRARTWLARREVQGGGTQTRPVWDPSNAPPRNRPWISAERTGVVPCAGRVWGIDLPTFQELPWSKGIVIGKRTAVITCNNQGSQRGGVWSSGVAGHP